MTELKGARLKWKRANFHLDGLVDDFIEWPRSNKYHPVLHTNDERTKLGLAVYREGDDPPDDWAVVVGEILYNYRCALNHGLYELVARRTLTDPPEHAGKIQFPVANTPKRFAGAIGGKQLGALGDDSAVKDAIEGLQSYRDIPDDGHPHGLDLVHILNNADKHRLLLVVSANVAILKDFKIEGLNVDLPANEEIGISINPGPFEEETTFLLLMEADFPFAPEDMSKVTVDTSGIQIGLCLEVTSGTFLGCKWILERCRDAVEKALGVMESLAD